MNKYTEQFKLKQIGDIFLKDISFDTNLKKYEILNYEFKDDCSYIKLSDENMLVISSDFIRGEHFNMFYANYLSYYDLGYFLVIANLSDIASSGGTPLGISLILRYTNTMTNDNFQSILLGIDTACKEYDLDVLGGDTGSYKESVIAATIIGTITNHSPMLRTNAKVGDSVYISSVVGLAITSMVYFLYAKEKGFSLNASEEDVLLKQWKSPKAFIDMGMLLVKNNLSLCCQDVSDGLKASIEQIAKASDVSIQIEQSQIPISNITKKVASFLNLDPYKMVFSISADFTLLFTINQDKVSDMKKTFLESEVEYYCIGKVIEKRKNIFLTKSGVEELPGIKWEHQSGDFIEDVIKNASL